MRPWVGESLTLALFEIRRNLKLVVCQPGVEDLEERLLGENLSSDKLGEYVWNDISKAFACPVSQEERESAYPPTQILAEAFKVDGFDGLAYPSGLERGTNIVLFDFHLAKLVHRFVFALKKVRYDFEAAPNFGIYRTNGRGQVISEIQTESP